MKIIKKIVAVLAILLVLCIAALIALPIIYKKDIVRYIKTDLNKEFKGEIQFDEDISLSLFNHFPKLTLGISNFYWTGEGEFVNDTLFQSDKITSTINLGALVKKQKVEINYLELNQPSVYLVSSSTAANWDIFESNSSDTATSVAFSSGFEKILISNGRFRYIDTGSTVLMDIDGITGNFSGLLTQDNFDLNSSFGCENALLDYDDVPYINKVPLKIDASTSINLVDNIYSFKENTIYVGNMLISGSGDIRFDENDNMNFDLEYGSKNSSFKELLSLVPAYFKSDLEGLTADGNASITGSLKGLLSDNSFPAYDFSLLLNDGKLAHSSLSQPFEHVNLNLFIDNQDGQDNSLTVNLKRLNFIHNNEPIEVKLLLKSLYTDPYIKGGVNGQVNLEDLGKLMASEEVQALGGDLLCNVNFDGRYSAIENEDYEKFKSSGNITATDIKYQAEDFPPVHVSSGKIEFNSTSVSLPLLDMTAGKSDLKANGKFDNFFGYVLNDETLSGDLTITSNLLDANEFTSAEEEVSDSLAPLSIVVPGNLELDVVYNFETIKVEEYELTHLVGNSTIKDNAFQINQLNTQFMGGIISFNGFYNTSNPSLPLADLNMTVQDLDIAKAFSIPTLQKLAPIAKYVKGIFSSTFHIRTSLLNDFSPDLKSITCQGVLDVFNCDIQGLKSFNQLAAQLNYDAYKEPVKIKDLILSFGIKDGKVEVSPFDLPIGETFLNLGGYSALDKSIKFDGLLTIPKKLYLQNTQQLNSYIPQNQLNKLDSVDFQNLELAVDIAGSFTKPTVKLAYKTMTRNIKDQIKLRAKQEVDKRKEELKKKAETELNKAKIAAEAAKEEAEDKAKKAIEEQKRKMAEQIQQEKDSMKRQLEEELKKKRNDMLKKQLPPFKK